MLKYKIISYYHTTKVMSALQVNPRNKGIKIKKGGGSDFLKRGL